MRLVDGLRRGVWRSRRSARRVPRLRRRRLALDWWSRPTGLAYLRALSATGTGAIGAVAGFGSTLGLSAGARVALAFLALLGGLSVLLVTWREQRLPATWVRAYLRRVAERPHELVGSGRARTVVGRDDLCALVMGEVVDRRLRERRARRAYALVGGPGAGKTAVLARLAQLLAAEDVAAVYLTLRDAEVHRDLDLVAQARARFLETAATEWQLTDAEADAAWRRLRDTDRLVVLVDDVEQAMMPAARDDIRAVDLLRRALALAHGGGVGEQVVSAAERQEALRGAVERTRRHNVPLVLASRPDPALARLDVTEVEVDVLSEAAAVEHLMAAGLEHESSARHIVRLGGLAEAPFYLEIACDLAESWLFERRGLDLRGADRVGLRVRLVEAWFAALVQAEVDPWGRPGTAVALDEAQREDALHQAAALACCGMVHDRQEVAFDELEVADTGQPRYSALGMGRDVRAGADDAALLGVVESRRGGVRFRDATMQAHLGARMLASALGDPSFRADALRSPGRMLLLAMVALSRTRDPRTPTGGSFAGEVLWAALEPLPPDARLPVLTAILDIETVGGTDDQGAAARLAALWSEGAALNAGERTRIEVVEPVARAAARAPHLYEHLHAIALGEPAYQVRSTAAEAIGRGGEAAYDVLGAALDPRPRVPDADERATAQHEREQALRAWIVPMVTAGVNDPAALDGAHRLIRRWIGSARTGELSPEVEAALAQGFKRAANVRTRTAAERGWLGARAVELLEGARFWLTAVNLLHALCLLELSQQTAPNRQRGDGRAVVAGWAHRVETSGHPFVAAAAVLAGQALRSGRPERFVWIDESVIVTRAGSTAAAAETPAEPEQVWLPNSSGWLQLDPAAQQLLGDMVVVLNLARRGGSARQREDRLERTVDALPPCIAGTHRERLSPRTVGVTRFEPGANCMPGCNARLCPYPAKRRHADQIELSAAFCRNQRTLLSRFRARAPWQHAQRAELREFWFEMEERARA